MLPNVGRQHQNQRLDCILIRRMAEHTTGSKKMMNEPVFGRFCVFVLRFPTRSDVNGDVPLKILQELLLLCFDHYRNVSVILGHIS